MSARIVSVNVGRVSQMRSTRGADQPTGIRKTPVTGPVMVDRQGFAGDESAYRSRELGDTAVHMFSLESYDRFKALGAASLPIPSFGENLTLTGYSEDVARVGDVLQLGTAILQVTQPVVRCSWPSVLTSESRLTRWATQKGLTGGYLSVVTPGSCAAGDALVLMERGPEGWTLTRLNAAYRDAPKTRALADEILALPELAERWKQDFRRRLG